MSSLMGKRTFVTGVVIILSSSYLVFGRPWAEARHAEVVAGQLSSDATLAAQSAQAASTDPSQLLLWIVVGAVLLVTWFDPVMAIAQRKFQANQQHVSLVVLLLIGAVALSACGTATAEIKEIQSNETAFLIPIAGDPAQQTKFESVDYLKSKMVAGKQVILTKSWKATGKTLFIFDTGDWYPAERLIVVKRTLVTREWTKAASTGTSNTDQSFGVESAESIDFTIGATGSALIAEEDAPTYLYYYGEADLNHVMDTNVRGFVQQALFDEFGKLTLAVGQVSKQAIFAKVRDELITTFKARGITITSFGGQGGMTYTDPKIQDSINQAYAAQQQVIIAQSQATQQSIVARGASQQRLVESEAQATQQGYDNMRLISQSQAQATATVVAGAAQAAVMQQDGQILATYPGLTNYLMAQKSNGQVPQILVMGNNSGASGLPFTLFLTPPPVPTYTPTPSR